MSPTITDPAVPDSSQWPWCSADPWGSDRPLPEREAMVRRRTAILLVMHTESASAQDIMGNAYQRFGDPAWGEDVLADLEVLRAAGVVGCGHPRGDHRPAEYQITPGGWRRILLEGVVAVVRGTLEAPTRAEDFSAFPPCGVFSCTLAEPHGHASRGTFAKPGAVRFATPEIEAAVRAWQAKKREEKRRNRLLIAIRNFAFNRCQGHGAGGTGTCVVCAIDFFLGGEAATALKLIDAELAATVPTLVQFGHGWRIPVGPALAARIVELLALPAGERMMQQLKGTDLVPEPPVIDMICTGGSGPAECPTHMRLSPIEDGHTTPGLAIDVPIAFLLEHGVRFA